MISTTILTIMIATVMIATIIFSISLSLAYEMFHVKYFCCKIIFCFLNRKKRLIVSRETIVLVN